MRDEHNGEFVVAFAVGALIGVGAALLLAPDPPTRREKIMKELKPYRKTLRKKTSSARKQVGRRASAAADLGDELISAGRAVAADLREEIADLVSEARSEIAATVEDQLEAAQDALKKGAKRVRR
ncbi:MAG TPA: YtxH domain-containing protein [Longimicrobiales bacterium]|nr:YtxH domain-containing protein [Longimicrobiales bacterium]